MSRAARAQRREQPERRPELDHLRALLADPATVVEYLERDAECGVVDLHSPRPGGRTITVMVWEAAEGSA